MNARVDPIEAAIAKIEHLLESAADARAEAEAADERRKQTLSVMVVHHKAQGCGVAEAEHQARASDAYKTASDAWIAANYAHRKADAKAEAARLRFESWRTKQATKRAEMQLR